MNYSANNMHFNSRIQPLGSNGELYHTRVPMHPVILRGAIDKPIQQTMENLNNYAVRVTPSGKENILIKKENDEYFSDKCSSVLSYNKMESSELKCHTRNTPSIYPYASLQTRPKEEIKPKTRSKASISLLRSKSPKIQDAVQFTGPNNFKDHKSETLNSVNDILFSNLLPSVEGNYSYPEQSTTSFSLLQDSMHQNPVLLAQNIAATNPQPKFHRRLRPENVRQLDNLGRSLIKTHSSQELHYLASIISPPIFQSNSHISSSGESKQKRLKRDSLPNFSTEENQKSIIREHIKPARIPDSTVQHTVIINGTPHILTNDSLLPSISTTNISTEKQHIADKPVINCSCHDISKIVTDFPDELADFILEAEERALL